MTSTSVSPVRRGKTAGREGFLAPALYVSIAIAIFAVVTQLLVATGAASLSTTQQLTMWLAAAGLTVLLWIAYMICRAYVTARAEKAEAEQARAAAAEANARRDEALAAKAAAEQEAKAAQEQTAQARQDAEQQKDRAANAEAEAELAGAAAAEANARRDEALAAKAAAEQELKTAQDELTSARKDAEKAHAAALDANEQRTEAVAAKARVEQELKDARKMIAKLLLDHVELLPHPGDGSGQVPPGQPEDESAGADENTWAPPAELRYLDGSERSVSMAEVFPDGCCLEPGSFRPVVDKLTGRQVYQCRVLDLNPALKNRSHETVVKILANQEPSLPFMPRFGEVKFDGLTITAYVIDQSQMRIRYALRATGIHPAAVTAEERVQATWTTPDSPEAVTSEKARAHGIIEGAGAAIVKEAVKEAGVDIVSHILHDIIF